MSRHNKPTNELAHGAAEQVKRSINVGATPVDKADLLESLMIDGMRIQVKPPWLAQVDVVEPPGLPDGRFLMGDDPRLPPMPARPMLEDFYQLRVALNPTGLQHMLQSAARAVHNGCSDHVVLACLLHDIAVTNLVRSDHGYWAAQMIEPYVHAEVAWSVKYHQALRYFPAPEYDYDYPTFYKEVFGEKFDPPDYLHQAREVAMAHPWYDSAMQVVVNDFYAFQQNTSLEFTAFSELVETHFRQPAAGLGFDESPSAHMWRTMIWPNNFL
jgi:hypothetical protein